jgi:hypothetical protein
MMAMSRKHYREVAEIIREQVAGVEWDAETNGIGAGGFVLKAVANGLATMFQIDNSNFDRSQFLEACGIK